MASFSDDNGISDDDGQLREVPSCNIVQDTNKAVCKLVNYYAKKWGDTEIARQKMG